MALTVDLHSPPPASPTGVETEIELVWSREDDVTHDLYRPPSLHPPRSSVASGRVEQSNLDDIPIPRIDEVPPITVAAARGRRRPLPARVPAVWIVLCGLFFSTASPATILIFDQQRDATTGTVVGTATSGGTPPADYGDRVTGAAMAVPGGIFTYGQAGEGFTANVSIDLYSTGANETNPRVRLWGTGYGDLVNVVFGEGPGTGGSPILDVLFTADPGFVVDLHGFELAALGSADLTIAAVESLAGSATLLFVGLALLGAGRGLRRDPGAAWMTW